MGDLRIRTYVLGMMSTNCYIIYREKEAVVIGPADSRTYIANQCRELGAMPVAVLLIHGYFDHITAVDDLRKLPLLVYAGVDGEALLRNTSLNLSTSFGHSSTTRAGQYMKDGEMSSLPGKTWKVIATPGHASGSMCYLIDDEDALFSGDTLFAESPGRTDFPMGSSGQTVVSIMEKLFPLRDDIMVYLGRGEPTTIGHEKQYNPATAYRR